MLNYNELKYIATKMAEEKNEAERIADMLRQTTLPEEAGKNPPVDVGDQIRGALGATPMQGESYLDKLKMFGEHYGGAMGLGAGTGAVAGIPIALLANALMGGKENRNLRGYLKSALIGALLGGGVGALGGAGVRAYLLNNPDVSNTLGKALGRSQQNAKGFNYIAPETMQYIERLKKGIPGLLAPKPSDKSMDLAEQGLLGIPGVTRDSFGMDPERTNTLSSTGIGAIRSALTRQSD